MLIEILLLLPLDVGDGLCCQLTEPCPKVRPTVQFRELEVARESVKLMKKLGSGCFGDVHAGKSFSTCSIVLHFVYNTFFLGEIQ